MNRIVLRLLLFLFLLPVSWLYAASIILHSRDAVAWLPQQTIRGSLAGFTSKQIIIHHDKKTFSIRVDDSSFQFSFVLHDGINHIWAETRNKENQILSDTVDLTLGYHSQPLLIPVAEVQNRNVFLHAKIVTNTVHKLRFHWTADRKNPAPTLIHHARDSIADVQIPQVNGMYYFNLFVTSGKDTVTCQTFVTRKGTSLRAFDLNTQHAPWIDSAVVYEISPHAFVSHPTYDDITAKLPEIKILGVNTIWLQPLMQNIDQAQGYEVTDYFSLRTDLGSEAQLQRLINTAKRLGLRVLFDFVPNHTSIHHPYAQDCAAYRENSHYYYYYQHTNDGAMYSSHYHTDSSGFVYYFWDDLVNLDYSNKEVQQWILEACKYWVKKYDIDGYRFDAVWGVNARQPDFGKRLQTELKSIKPDLFFLAEDKAFGGALEKGFDAVYDWTADTGWVSQWSLQYEYHPTQSLTIFNHPDKEKRVQLMHKILFDKRASNGLRLRFLENNDLPRFVATHNIEQTKTAAMLMFLLPGIPMIYNGQEAGIKTFPSKKRPTFMASQSIRSLDTNGLFSFYQKLIALRAAHPCLHNQNMEEVPLVSNGFLLAFRRWDENESIITVFNMDSVAAVASFNINKWLAKESNAFTLTDLITGKAFVFQRKEAAAAKVPVGISEAQIFLLSQQE